MFEDRQKIEQNGTGYSTDESEIYTEGLGPCIAVCIAWRHWAAMIHLAEISESEDDLAAMIATTKAKIPEEVLPKLRPFVCGGDTEDPCNVDDDPEETERRVLRGRKRVLAILVESGFSEPHVRWNEPSETSSLHADLDKGVVLVVADHVEVAHWPIVH